MWIEGELATRCKNDPGKLALGGAVEERDNVDDQEHRRAGSFGQFKERKRATTRMDGMLSHASAA